MDRNQRPERGGQGDVTPEPDLPQPAGAVGNDFAVHQAGHGNGKEGQRQPIGPGMADADGMHGKHQHGGHTDPPVIGRIVDDRLVFDTRTLLDGDEERILMAIQQALAPARD